MKEFDGETVIIEDFTRKFDLGEGVRYSCARHTTCFLGTIQSLEDRNLADQQPQQQAKEKKSRS